MSSSTPVPTPDIVQTTRLLASKLSPPHFGNELIARPRLLDQLAFPPGGGLTVIVAPAGSGKTSLMSQWLLNVERRAQSVEQPNSEYAGPVLRSTWLSLDEDDNDPRRFWRHLFAALEPALPKLAESWALLQRLEAAELGTAAITALITQLAGANQPICLILDDYHCIRDGNDAIHGAMANLIAQWPAQLHLIIASRSEPPLPPVTGHRRLAMADLAFRADEAAALVAQALGVAAPSATLNAIVTKTEGWAAGVRLAALVLAEGQDLAGIAAGFGGSHQYVFDYLMEEIFSTLPPAVQALLLVTSLPNRVCAALCVALLAADAPLADGQPVPDAEAAQRMLERLARQGLFLLPLDTAQGWFRYHQLFREFLRHRLAQTGPQRVRILWRAAGHWFAQQDLIDEAVAALVAGDAAAGAADLVERRVGHWLWERYEAPAVRGWLDRLPMDSIHTRWRLIVADLLTSLQGGPAAIAAYAAPRIEALLQLVPPDPWRTAWLDGAPPPPEQTAIDREHRALLAQLTFVLLNNDRLVNGGKEFARLARLAEQWITPDDGALYLTLVGSYAIVACFQGDMAAAARSYRTMGAQANTAGSPPILLAARIGEGTAAFWAGQIEAARQHFVQALSDGRRHQLQRTTIGAMALARLGRLEYERDQREAAQRALEASLDIPWQWWEPESRVPAAFALALTRAADGAYDAAHQALDQIEHLAELGQDQALLAVLGALRAQLWLRCGAPERACHWLAGATPEAIRARYAGLFLALREPADLALARVLLAAGRATAARDLLDEVLGHARAQGRERSRWEAGMLLALAHSALGAFGEALDLLDSLLPELLCAGLVRLVLDEGEPARALLVRRAARGRPGDQGRAAAEQFLQRFNSPGRGQEGLPDDHLPPLVEPLSDRELDVLRLLDIGATTRQIAEQLQLAESTVKWHVRNLCGKLQVRTRLQVVARARAIGLLT